MIRRAWTMLGFLVLLLAGSAWAQIAVPELSRPVTDLTQTLSASQIAALEGKLAVFEARTGSQIAVLMVPTTQPEDIAQYGIRVADQWKLGRKKIEDGVILIVAKDDRKLRIEVGYGLEGAIPDAIARRVIAEVITPRFKNGDFSGGIDAGVNQLMRLIEGESLPAPTAESPTGGSGENLLIIAVLGFFLGSFFSSMMGRGLASSVAGAGVAGVAWTSMGTWLSPLLMGLGVFVAVLLLGGRHWGSGGGWSSGGGGGFGGGSLGGGGGSWGGGGGGFGGGGASGSW
ncbi:MAG: YgcG family protein [Thiobacillus sp.]|nr:YgcG family protein [Thiobacillus sp.]